MGFIGSLFGGDNGASFRATGATNDQANQLFGQQQDAFGQQQNFLNALQGQNSSNPFANQLNALAAGGGPNPALNQLAQTTGQNVASQAALQAGQRGAGSNPGLLARNIAQQGAQTQQMAGGQAATLGAQQQLGAINQMGQLQSGALQGLNNSALQGQNNVLGSIGNQNSSNSNVQAANAHAQGGALGGLLGGVGAVLGLNQGGMVQPSCYACGGMVKGYDQGGQVQQPMPQMMNTAMTPEMPSDPSGPQSSVGQFMKGFNEKPQNDMRMIANTGQKMMGDLGKFFAQGGKVGGKAPTKGDSPKNDVVPAMLSPGEVVIPKSKTKDSAKTAEFVNAVLGMSLKPGKKRA